MRFNRTAANDNRYTSVHHISEKRDKKALIPDRTEKETAAFKKMMFSVINPTVQPGDAVTSRIMTDSMRYSRHISDIVAFGGNFLKNASNDSLPPIGLSDAPGVEKQKESKVQQIIRLLTTVYNDIGSKALNRDEFIRDIKKLDHQGKLPEKIYAIKYKLSELLDLPDAAMWEHIITKLEKDNPNENWVNIT